MRHIPSKLLLAFDVLLPLLPILEWTVWNKRSQGILSSLEVG